MGHNLTAEACQIQAPFFAPAGPVPEVPFFLLPFSAIAAYKAHECGPSLLTSACFFRGIRYWFE
jgi:hypothetical protein